MRGSSTARKPSWAVHSWSAMTGSSKRPSSMYPQAHDCSRTFHPPSTRPPSPAPHPKRVSQPRPSQPTRNKTWGSSWRWATASPPNPPPDPNLHPHNTTRRPGSTSSPTSTGLLWPAQLALGFSGQSMKTPTQAAVTSAQSGPDPDRRDRLRSDGQQRSAAFLPISGRRLRAAVLGGSLEHPHFRRQLNYAVAAISLSIV
jgi:hypothetical protein